MPLLHQGYFLTWWIPCPPPHLWLTQEVLSDVYDWTNIQVIYNYYYYYTRQVPWNIVDNYPFSVTKRIWQLTLTHFGGNFHGDFLSYYYQKLPFTYKNGHLTHFRILWYLSLNNSLSLNKTLMFQRNQVTFSLLGTKFLIYMIIFMVITW